MDLIDIRDILLRELKKNQFNTTDQAGNNLTVVEDSDFVEIADSVTDKIDSYMEVQKKQFLITSFDKMDKTHITMLELAQFDDLADKLLDKEDLKTCDVCGSENTITVSNKGENCDWCNPL